MYVHGHDTAGTEGIPRRTSRGCPQCRRKRAELLSTVYAGAPYVDGGSGEWTRSTRLLTNRYELRILIDRGNR
jgi:hypothetical protein